MNHELRIGIAGLGVVGKGVYEILTKDLNLINRRSKRGISIVAVASRTKKDFVNYSAVKFYSNPLDLAEDKNIDVVVEVIGGSEGVAYELCKKALQNQKHFVTANKAMIANHGAELAKLAAKNNVNLCFEASVAGSIPVLKNIKEGLSANNISRIYAILNGTCNYILTKMEENNADFAVALKEAQKLGYAESDPSFDIEGTDTAHKISILAAIARNAKPKLDSTYIEGITAISVDDIRFANQLGYKIKLLGIFQDLGVGRISQAVYPCLVASQKKIATINDAYNAILTLGHNSSWNFQSGRGAGGKPTASSIVADIIDIACNRCSDPFGADIDNLTTPQIADISERVGGYYLRFMVKKQSAKQPNFIVDIFGDQEIIDRSIIEEVDGDNLIYAVKTTNISENQAVEIVNKLKSNQQVKEINLIRIEEMDF